MISFVWSSIYPLMAGTGGSENYTIGHIRELSRRGLKVNVITVGLGENDGRIEFPDISFTSISDIKELEKLDTTLIFVSEPLNVKTKKKSYVILHCPRRINYLTIPHLLAVSEISSRLLPVIMLPRSGLIRYMCLLVIFQLSIPSQVRSLISPNLEKTRKFAYYLQDV